MEFANNGRLRAKIGEAVLQTSLFQLPISNRFGRSSETLKGKSRQRSDSESVSVREVVRRLFREAEEGRGAIDLEQFTNFVRKRLRVNCPVSHVEALFDGSFDFDIQQIMMFSLIFIRV